MGIEYAIIGGAIIGAVGSVATAAMAPSPPKIPPPPPPASYYSYDNDGNPAGEQVWDAEKNAYIYKPAELTPEQKVEKEQRDSLRSQMLSNLDAPPADRVAAYDQYAKTFASAMHHDVDKRYQETVDSTREYLHRTGRAGSTAEVDTLGRLREEKSIAE